MKPLLPPEQEKSPIPQNRPDAAIQATRPAPLRRRPTIIDGPFTESKELLGGSWPPAAKRR